MGTKKRTLEEVDGGLNPAPSNSKVFIASDKEPKSIDDRLKGANRDFSAVLYFYALDRFPGGNADMYIMKYILTVYHQWIRLEKVNRSNWDGENSKSKYLFAVDLSKDDLEKYVSKVVDSFIALKQNPKADECGGDMEYEQIDPRKDSEECDTKWSGLHFNLYLAPRKGFKSLEAKKFSEFDEYNLGRPIYKIIDDILGDSWDYEHEWQRYLRVEVYTLYRNRPYGPLPKVTFPISDDANNVIAACKELCGITTVQEHSDNISRSAKSDDKDEVSVVMEVRDGGAYEMPDELELGVDYQIDYGSN